MGFPFSFTAWSLQRVVDHDLRGSLSVGLGYLTGLAPERVIDAIEEVQEQPTLNEAYGVSQEAWLQRYEHFEGVAMDCLWYTARTVSDAMRPLFERFFGAINDLDGKPQSAWGQFDADGSLAGEFVDILKDIEPGPSGESAGGPLIPTVADPPPQMVSVWFLGRVMLPVWFHYRTTPYALLRAARGGDAQALKKLASVDKTIIADPSLMRRYSIDASGQRELSRAILNHPPAFNPGRLKIYLGAHLAWLTRLLNCRVSYAQIVELFDAMAKDRLQTEHDRDLRYYADGSREEMFRKDIRFMEQMMPVPEG